MTPEEIGKKVLELYPDTLKDKIKLDKLFNDSTNGADYYAGELMKHIRHGHPQKKDKENMNGLIAILTQTGVLAFLCEIFKDEIEEQKNKKGSDNE